MVVGLSVFLFLREGRGRLIRRSRVKGAGSFLRPTISGLSFGKPFRKALKDKYQPKFEEEGGEKSQFFETSFVKPIEVVPLGRVRERFKNLGGLKEVGLEGEEVVGLGEEGDGEEEVLTSTFMRGTVFVVRKC